MVQADAALLMTALADRKAWSTKNDEEIHSINANAWVVLNSKIDVLLDTEPEVTGAGESILVKLVLLHLMQQEKSIDNP